MTRKTKATGLVNDARGVVVGPVWAREEAARRNREALRDAGGMGLSLLWALALVLGAWLLAAWLDENVRTLPEAAECCAGIAVEG